MRPSLAARTLEPNGDVYVGVGRVFRPAEITRSPDHPIPRFPDSCAPFRAGRIPRRAADCARREIVSARPSCAHALRALAAAASRDDVGNVGQVYCTVTGRELRHGSQGPNSPRALASPISGFA
jgi:hypothetical protein